MKASAPKAGRGMPRLALAALGLLLWQPAAAADVALGPRSKLWLEGTSTLHAFESTATKMTLAAQVQPAQPPAAGATGLGDGIQGGGLRGLELDIPVTELKSGKSGLDKNMYAALKAKDFPAIHFSLVQYELKPHPSVKGAFLLEASGQLTIAGKRSLIKMTPEALPEGAGLRIRGSQDLLMTDYGITPPSLMLGALKTGDRVTVHFDLSLDLKKAENENERSGK